MFALHDDQGVLIEIFVSNVPGLVAGVLTTTDSQSLPLPKRVEHQAMMLADFLAIGSLDGTGDLPVNSPTGTRGKVAHR